MQKVLLVDDDIEMFTLIKSLSRDVFELLHAKSLQEADHYLKSTTFDLLILDIELGDGSGIDFFLSHRAEIEKLDVPVFMLSAHDELEHKLESFELGAVDFVKKPFIPMELIARLKVSLRSKIKKTSEIIKKDIIVDIEFHRVFLEIAGVKNHIDFSPTEYKLFLLLCKNEDKVFGREQLMDMIWGEKLNVTDRTVDQHISKIRKKLNSQYYTIKTSHALGYSFSKI